MADLLPPGPWLFYLDGERLGQAELSEMQFVRVLIGSGGAICNGFLRLDAAPGSPEPPYFIRGMVSSDPDTGVVVLQGEIKPSFRGSWQPVSIVFQVNGGTRDGGLRHLEAEMQSAPFLHAERGSPWVICPEPTPGFYDESE